MVGNNVKTILKTILKKLFCIKWNYVAVRWEPKLISSQFECVIFSLHEENLKYMTHLTKRKLALWWENMIFFCLVKVITLESSMTGVSDAHQAGCSTSIMSHRLQLQCSVAHRWRDTAGGRCDENHMTNESYWSEKLERSGLVIKSHCQDFT